MESSWLLTTEVGKCDCHLVGKAGAGLHMPQCTRQSPTSNRMMRNVNSAKDENPGMDEVNVW